MIRLHFGEDDIRLEMKELIKEGLFTFGIDLSDEQLRLFLLFYEELKKWGKKINLTSLLEKEVRLVEELFVDAVAPTAVIRKEGMQYESLLDIGSGAGIPGIPLKIINPFMKISLTDTREKRVLFMRQAIRKLSLKKIEAKKTRFGDKGADELEKEYFDWAISKAVAEIDVLGRWAYPHLRQGGVLLCMKSADEEEVRIAAYSQPGIYRYTLPFSGFRRKLLIYEKL